MAPDVGPESGFIRVPNSGGCSLDENTSGRFFNGKLFFMLKPGPPRQRCYDRIDQTEVVSRYDTADRSCKSQRNFPGCVVTPR